jgi:hypothetical protein
MAITSLPAVPQRSDPTNFATKADAFLAALPTFVSDANTLAANLNSIAAGGAYAIPYTYAATPTPVGQAAGGRLSFNSGGTATTANSIYADVKSSGGSTVTAILNDFNASSSTVKGVIRLVKVGDTTKWATFNVSAYVLNGGGLYGIATVTPVAQSSATPFNDGDSLVLFFQRTGDIGSQGTLVRRTASTASVGTTAPDMNTTDMYIITAQAASLTLGAPTGALTDGRQLMYRIKDNGTARTISYTTNYRASVELPFPSTTIVSKTLYLGFIYNAADAKWDLIAAINNM